MRVAECRAKIHKPSDCGGKLTCCLVRSDLDWKHAIRTLLRETSATVSALVDLLEKRCFLGGTYLWYVQIVQIGLLIRNRVSSNIPVSLAGRGG